MVGQNILENVSLKNFEFFSPTRVEVDLLSYDSVKNYISKIQPELVIHCAGKVGGIQANIKNPVGFLVENLDMGKNVVLASHEIGIKKLINLGTSCMYPRNHSNGLKEDMILKGELEPTNEGYALAKIVVAKLCEYINNTDPDFHYKTVIPCNLYGRWDKFTPSNSHMIPAVIKKIDDAKRVGLDEVEIWGDGLARREFMFAGEVTDFLSFAIPQIESMPTYMNIGLGYDFTINEYYEAVAEVVGYKGKFKHDLTKPVGMNRKLSDITLQTKFGWKSKIDLKEGLKKTYDFYLGRRHLYGD